MKSAVRIIRSIFPDTERWARNHPERITVGTKAVRTPYGVAYMNLSKKWEDSIIVRHHGIPEGL